MFLGAGRISLLDRCDFLGILCKVWKWEGKVLEWNDWAMSPVLRLEIEYSGRVGERMRLLCGVLTNTQSYISELGQTVPEQKQETSVCANCMQVLKTSVGQSPCVPGEQADGFNCSTRDWYWKFSLPVSVKISVLLGCVAHPVKPVCLQWQSPVKVLV